MASERSRFTMSMRRFRQVAIVTVAGQRGLPLKGFMVRKEAKGHGTGKQVEGPVQPGNRVVVVEDVITSGGSALKAVDAAEAFAPITKFTRNLALGLTAILLVVLLLLWAVVPLPFLYIVLPPFWLLAMALGLFVVLRPDFELRLSGFALNAVWLVCPLS